MQMQNHRWQRVRSRKFVADISIDGALETVEYTWFVDDSCIVTITRVPFSSNNMYNKVCLNLFYTPHDKPLHPLNHPQYTIFTYDRNTTCSSCTTELCSCSDAVAPPHVDHSNCIIIQSKRLDGNQVEAHYITQSWKDRFRLVTHGTKRGIATIVLNPLSDDESARFTICQDFVSMFHDENSISARVEQHVTRMLSKLPQMHHHSLSSAPHQSTSLRPPRSESYGDGGGSAPSTYVGLSDPPSQSQSLLQSLPSLPLPSLPPLARESSWQSSILRSDGVNSSKGNSYSPHGGRSISPLADRSLSRNDCHSLSPLKDHSLSPRNAGQSLSPLGHHSLSPRGSQPVSHQENQSLPLEPIAMLTAPLKEDPIHRSATGSLKQSMTASSTCGPEKAGAACNCTSETTRSKDLARILNDKASCLDDHETPMSSGSGSPLAAACSSSPEQSMHNSTRPQERMTLGDLASSEINSTKNSQFNSKMDPQSSMDSTIGGVGNSGSLSLPSISSPLGRTLPFLSSSSVKRPRTDPSLNSKSDPLAFPLGSSSWLSASPAVSRDKELPTLSSWNLAALPERPQSALGRAFSIARSPSPVGLPSKIRSPPSPNLRLSFGATSTTGQFPQSANQSLDFSNAFELLPQIRDGPSTSKEAKESSLPSVSFDRTESNEGDKYKKETEPEIESSAQKSVDGSSCNGASSGNSGVCCEICGISFAKRGNKMRHILTVHNRLKQFECDLCGAKFGLKADLGRHRFRIHESRAFICETCGKSFAEESQLELHVRVTHEEDARPWECRTCHIRFGRKSSLTRHEQTVHQHTRFVCRVCKKSYSQRFDAIRHERKVHGLNDKNGGVVLRQ